MNPMPHEGVIPTMPLPADGYLELVLLATIVALFAMLGWMLWTVGRTQERRRVICPVRHAPMKVLFGLAADGTRTDVLDCPVFRNRPITCDKACLHPTRAA